MIVVFVGMGLFAPLLFRFRGAKGRARFAALGDREAQLVHDRFTVGTAVPTVIVSSFACGLASVLFLLRGITGLGVACAVGAALHLTSWWALRTSRPGIVRTFAERDLDPLADPALARQRHRRTTQLALVGITGAIVWQLGDYLAVVDHQPAFQLVGGLGLLSITVCFAVNFRTVLRTDRATEPDEWPSRTRRGLR